MGEGVYKYIDIVGTSSVSIDDAIQKAIAQASKTIRQIQWFELKEVRGRVDQGKVAEIQASMRLGFRLE
jgi:flavin-binding protein dodecin